MFKLPFTLQIKHSIFLLPRSPSPPAATSDFLIVQVQNLGGSLLPLVPLRSSVSLGPLPSSLFPKSLSKFTPSCLPGLLASRHHLAGLALLRNSSELLPGCFPSP